MNHLFLFVILWLHKLLVLSSAEVVTLLKDSKVTCVVSGSDSRLPIHISPPVLKEFSKNKTEINTWLNNTWEETNSFDSNHTIVLDKRWQDLEMLHSRDGHSLKEKGSFPFSICAEDVLVINLVSSDFQNESFLNVTAVDNLSEQQRNQNDAKCKWMHYIIVKENRSIHLRNQERLLHTYPLSFEPKWIYFQNLNEDKDIFWKLHDYNFLSSYIQDTKTSTLIVNSTESLCLSMYLSIDEGCFLEIRIKNKEKDVLRKKYLSTNNDGLFRKWKKFEINTPAIGESYVSFFKGTDDPKQTKGFWAIDDLSYCSPEIETYKVDLSGEPPENYFCEILNQSEEVFSIDICNEPQLIGKNCNISCEMALGSDFPFCEEHKICLGSRCSCSWGYEGHCDQKCKNGTWGESCLNTCDCPDCHSITGECLTLPKTSAPLDLPLNVTLTSSNRIKLVLPNFQNNSTLYYLIMYTCKTKWCENQTINAENFVFDTATYRNRPLLLSGKNLTPLTDYEVEVFATTEVEKQADSKVYKVGKQKQESYHYFENLSIYSKNQSNLFVRFSTPESSVKRSYRVWYYEVNSRVRPKKHDFESCDLWDNYKCVQIGSLNPNSLYSLTVDSWDGKLHEYSDVIYGFTQEEASQAPPRLRVTEANAENATLVWDHPFVTNGPLKKFFVHVAEIGQQNISYNYTMLVSKHEKKYKYEVPLNVNTNYAISVRAFNQLEGAPSKMTTKLILTNPTYKANSTLLIETCTTLCYLLIPKPINLHPNSGFLILESSATVSTSKIKEYLDMSLPTKDKYLNILHHSPIIEENYLQIERKSNFDFKNNALYLVMEKKPQGNSDFHTIFYPNNISSALLSIVIPTIAFVVLVLLILIIVISRNKIRSSGYSKSTKSDPEYLLPSESMQDKFNIIDKTSLEVYLKRFLLLKSKEVIKQFKSVRNGRQTSSAAEQAKNKNKNKNQEHIPYDYNRVILKSMDGMGKTDYINASYINGFDRPKAYIATQGPKFCTVRDFWRMIWQEQVETIVMATNFVENADRKCAEYLPLHVGATFECGKMFIMLKLQEIYEFFDIRYLEVKYKNDTRKIQHFHFKWTPDDQNPLYPNFLVPLMQRISTIRERSRSPIVIHCSSGVKKTGTLILCDLALQMLQNKNCVNFHFLLTKLREQRPNIVTNEKQYILAQLVVLECIMEQENVFKKSLRENFDENTFDNQLMFLERLKWHDEVFTFELERQQVIGNLFFPVDGYMTKQKYKTAKTPDFHFVDSFWSEIIRQNIKVIAILQTHYQNIWPFNWQTSTEIVIIKPIKVMTSTYCTFTKLQISMYQMPQNILTFNKVVLCFTLKCTTISSILNILEDIHKLSNENNSILVTCNDGISLTGLFVTLSYIVNKCKQEIEVDVCNAIRTVRKCGLPFIQTKEELQFLYELTLEYLQKFDEYSSIL